MKNNFLLILTFFYCTLTWTQVKFEAEVSKNKLGVNENLRIDFKMNKDGDNFSPQILMVSILSEGQISQLAIAG